MTIETLLRDPGRRRFGAPRETDALRQSDALLEAELLEVRIDPLRATAWVLVDCRGAIQVDEGNTAVVAVNGLSDVRWTIDEPKPRHAQVILGWRIGVTNGGWHVEAVTLPGGQLVLSGAAAEFYVGNVPGGDAAPPDYTSASDDELGAGLPGWDKPFECVYATFLEPS